MSHFGYEKDSETGEYKIGITDSQKSYIRSLVKDKAKAGNIALFVPEAVTTFSTPLFQPHARDDQWTCMNVCKNTSVSIW